MPDCFLWHVITHPYLNFQFNWKLRYGWVITCHRKQFHPTENDDYIPQKTMDHTMIYPQINLRLTMPVKEAAVFLVDDKAAAVWTSCHHCAVDRWLRLHAGPVDVEYAGTEEVEYAGPVEVEYAGTKVVEYAGTKDIEYAGPVDIEYSGTEEVQYTVPVHVDVRCRICILDEKLRRNMMLQYGWVKGFIWF